MPNSLEILHLTSGALGVSTNSFIVKQGRNSHKVPQNSISRIVVENERVSISSKAVQICAALHISIDFIDFRGVLFAQLIAHKPNPRAILSQERQISLAREIIRTKITNQKNYLAYLDKYHKSLSRHTLKLDALKLKCDQAPNVDALRGIEGSAALIYWAGIRRILDANFTKRITRGAKDAVNSALNYGYAILYSAVQKALVLAGLDLYNSFLHAPDGVKPTLSFDFIEEFRTFLVDRVIISMFNKDEPVKLDSEGLLTKSSRVLIAANINEKLNSRTMWKKRRVKCENIIRAQALHLAKFLRGKERKYKGFVGKF